MKIDSFSTRLLLLSFALALAPSSVAAQPAAPASPQMPPEFVFKLAADQLDGSSIQVAGGFEVNASDWPALIFIRYIRPTLFEPKKGTCSASLVGPNVALMAAHCVDRWDTDMHGVTISPVLRIADRDIPMICAMHSDYAKRPLLIGTPRGSEDFALCVLDDKGVRPPVLKQMRFEVVDVATPLKGQDSVLLTGYGCDHLSVKDGSLDWTKADGKLRLGDGAIEKAPGSIAGSLGYATIRSANGIQSALCPGDSGGPLLSGVAAHDPDGVRRLRGVNSSIYPEQVGAMPAHYDFISSIAATGTDLFRQFAEDWLKANKNYKPEICGINVKAGERQCRN